MNRYLQNEAFLSGSRGLPVKRPLIGITTAREATRRFMNIPLYIMNQTYVRVVETLGALPVMIPLHMTEETLRGIFERLDGLLLPGGEDIHPEMYGHDPHPHLGATDPERDRTELLMTRWALAAGMPVLGICRGIQIINVACGGSLYQDLGSQRPDLAKHDYFPPEFERFRICHQVRIAGESVLADSLGRVHEVNSMHHQGIAQIGRGLSAVGIAEDGLVEAVEMAPLPFVVGVQWHPEELAKTDQLSASLFDAFVRTAASDWQSRVADDWPDELHRRLADGGPLPANGHR